MRTKGVNEGRVNAGHASFVQRINEHKEWRPSDYSHLDVVLHDVVQYLAQHEHVLTGSELLFDE